MNETEKCPKCATPFRREVRFGITRRNIIGTPKCVKCGWNKIDDLEAKHERLRRVAEKLLLCFPETIPPEQDEVEFNIPAYIVKELREAMASETEK